MQRLVSTVPVAAALLTGCAADTTRIESEYVSPQTYAAFDCAQIGAEFARLTRRAEDVGATVDRVAADDQAQAVVGIVLFWPALFFLEGGETAQTREYARLKGQIEALEKASVEKGCGVDLRQVAQTAPAPGAPSALQGLQALYRDGIISEEEYAERRKKISDAKIRQELAALEAHKAAARAESTTEPAGSASPVAAPAALRVAVLPLGKVNQVYGGVHTSVVQGHLLDRVWRTIRRDDRFELVYSTQSPDFDNLQIEDRPYELWPRGAGRAPRDEAIYRAVESAGADLGVALGWTRGPGGNELTAYVYDVRARRVYKRSGRNGSADTVEHIDDLLEDALREALATG